MKKPIEYTLLGPNLKTIRLTDPNQKVSIEMDTLTLARTVKSVIEARIKDKQTK